MTSQASTPFEVGSFARIYDPSAGEAEQWYINDHCFALGPDGVWHMFGITHAEPLNPMDEKCLAHACSPSLTQTPWRKLPFALTADRERWDEFHLWAPCIVRHEGTYYMYVCVGDEDHRTYKIHLAVSEDLHSWTRHAANPMVVDGFDARDPCVLRVRDRWIMYYTATSRPEGGHHIVAYRLSDDLVHWGERQVAFVDNETGTFGGCTESPFVLRRGASYYLFICNNDRKGGYDATDVYSSRDPFHWSLSDKVGTIPAHASEVLHNTDGKWYVSHCGWERGGLYLAPLAWHDGEEENECIYTPSVGIQASEGVSRMRHPSKI